MPRCSICKTKFKPKYSSLEKWCSPPCEHEYKVQLALKAAAKFRNDREKERKKESDAVLNKMKDRSMTLSDWIQICQKVFNTWVKLRDAEDGCISCGTRANVQYAAGHYYNTKTFGNLRFHPDNVHKQCNMNCNGELSGNLIPYRENLIKKIGMERFEALEALANVPRKYSIPEVKELIQYYKQKIKEMK